MQHFAVSPSPASSHPALPCPCGREHPLAECCLPVAERLRRGAGGRPSPFDEIRATSALLLWSLLSREAPGSPVRAALSAAARRFWCTALGFGSGAATTPDPESAWRTPEPSGTGLHDEHAEEESAYGHGLFERTWGRVDAGTLTWLLSALPSFVRDDHLLGELAIDWMLWDQPWLRGRPAGYWTMKSGSLAGRPRVHRTYGTILRSRVGLWRLEEHLPAHGFRLTDRLTGEQTLLHTESDPWPDADERLLLARIYAFGRWQLLAGRCLLLIPEAVDVLLSDLRERALTTQAPEPSDPRWRAWLAPWLIPLIARQWVSRLAPPPPDRYHGTYC